MTPSASTPKPLPTPRHWPLAALLAAITMIGPFAIDAYLPAFAAMRDDLGVAPIAIQQTLSAYLLAFAFMLLWHGAEAQRLLSQVTLIFGIAPAIAPVIGGALLETFGWRAIFWFVFVFTLAAMAWSWKSLPETLPSEARHPLDARLQLHSYRHVVTRPDFALLALVTAMNFSGFFLYIASAPVFLVDLLGVSTTGFAWLFVPMISGIMLGAAISGRVAGRLTPRQTVRLGYRFLFAGALLDLAVALLVPPGVPWHVLPILVFATGSATIMPSATLLLLDMFPANRGLAASLQGFTQFSVAALTAGTIAPLLSRSLPTLAAGMVAFAATSYALWSLYRRRHPEGPSA